MPSVFAEALTFGKGNPTETVRILRDKFRIQTWWTTAPVRVEGNGIAVLLPTFFAFSHQRFHRGQLGIPSHSEAITPPVKLKFSS